MNDRGDITRLLQDAARGDDAALEALTARVYGDLERVAARRMRDRFGSDLAGVTLEPAALVNETFLKLLTTPMNFENRRHFFAFATRVMLRALTDYQRARSAAKRGGDHVRLTLAGVADSDRPMTPGVDDVAATLEELEGYDPRKAQVVVLKVLWGLEMTEIATTLDVSLRTVERDWRFARNWLKTRLEAA